MTVKVNNWTSVTVWLVSLNAHTPAPSSCIQFQVTTCDTEAQPVWARSVCVCSVYSIHKKSQFNHKTFSFNSVWVPRLLISAKTASRKECMVTIWRQGRNKTSRSAILNKCWAPGVLYPLCNYYNTLQKYVVMANNIIYCLFRLKAKNLIVFAHECIEMCFVFSIFCVLRHKIATYCVWLPILHKWMYVAILRLNADGFCICVYPRMCVWCFSPNMPLSYSHQYNACGTCSCYRSCH